MADRKGPKPLVLPNGQEVHERILLFGGPDAGKTKALLDIAKWHRRLKSDAIFYILSTDMALEHNLMGDAYRDLDNVVFENVSTMADYIEAAKTFRSKMRSQDWFTVDLLNDGWAAAQDEYAEHKWGTDLADYWMTKAIDSDGSPIDGWDWGIVNKRYRSLANNYLLRMPGHVLCISSEAALREAAKSSGKGGETAQIKEMFGRIGRKPAGQKEDPHRFHTVIHMSQPMTGKWTAVQARDREREWKSFEVKDFFKDYLVGIAGWRMT